MREYPEAEVDRIIADAVMRMKPEDNAGWGAAYERIAVLLMERLVAAWADASAQRALRKLAAAEAQLRRFVGTRPCYLRLTAEQAGMFADTLELCVQATGACQAARPAWAIAGHGAHDDIAIVVARWSQACDDSRIAAHRAAHGRGMLVHTNALAQVHQGLQICFLLFMAADEVAAFSEQISLAIRAIGQTKLLFAAELGTQLQ